MFENSEDLIAYKSSVWHGTAVAWHNDLHSISKPLTVTHERFSAVVFAISTNCNILAISLYNPTSGKDDEFLETLDFLADFLVSNIPEFCNLIIGTDSNCSTKSSKRRQLAWSQFCTEFSILIKSTNTPTFHHNNGSSQSCIDYFATSNCDLFNLRQVCTLDNPTNFSSHDPVLATFSVESYIPVNNSKQSNTYTDFVRKKVLWDKSKSAKYKQLSDSFLLDASLYWDKPEAIPFLCSLFPKLLVKSAELAMDTELPKKASNGLKASTKREVAEAKVERAFQKWKASGRAISHPLRPKYLKAKADLQKLRRYEDNLKSIYQNNDLMSAHPQDKNKIYSKMKRYRGQMSNLKPLKLETPVGNFSGEDVLEGFSADARKSRLVLDLLFTRGKVNQEIYQNRIGESQCRQ